MEFLLEQNRAAFETFDAYSHLLNHQEHAMYQCLDAEKINSSNMLCGDYNSGKRKILAWMTRTTSGPALIAVKCRIDYLRWRHHFRGWTGRVDYLFLWKKKESAKKIARLQIVWYDRFIVDCAHWQPPTMICNYLWTLVRVAPKTLDSGSCIFLPSPFSLSVFHLNSVSSLEEWKISSAFDNQPLRLHSLLPFIRSVVYKQVEEKCPICFDSSEVVIATSCNHSFCPTCLFAHFLFNKFTCPLCRKKLDYEQTFQLTSSVPLLELVIKNFVDHCSSDEFCVVYDPFNLFRHIERVRLGTKKKVGRIVKISKSSIPLPYVTHLFSLIPTHLISPTLLKKYFSSFSRKKILNIIHIGN
jgi:hypothetical protein